MNPRDLANHTLDNPDTRSWHDLAEHYLVCLEALEKIEAGIGNANQVASMVLEHIRGE